MSPELANFYSLLQQWIDSDFTTPAYFKERAGLCHNLLCYCVAKGLNYEALSFEMTEQFRAAGLSCISPFRKNYVLEQYDGVLWQNPKRLEWVRNHVS